MALTKDEKLETIGIIGQLPPPVNGSNLITKILSETLKQNKYEVVLIDKRFSSSVLDVGRPSFKKVLKIPSFWWRIHRAAKNKQVNKFIYFSTSSPISFLIDTVGFFILRLHRKKIVQYLHTNGYHLLGDRNFFFRKLVQFQFSSSAVVVCLSKELGANIDSLVNSQKIVIIPNTSPIENEEDESRVRKNKFPPEHVLFLSNLSKSKGVHDFISAAFLIHQRAPEVKFTISGGFGTPELMQSINHQISSLGLTQIIKISGAADYKEKIQLYTNSAVLIYPSYDDAQPLTLIEAFQFGLPVVAYKTGSIPSMITQDFNGYLVDHGDVEQLSQSSLSLLKDKNNYFEKSTNSLNVYQANYSNSSYLKSWKFVIANL